MKKLPFIFLLLTALCYGFVSCVDSDEDTWNEYKEWRETNESWLAEKAQKKNTDGSDFYKKISPAWDRSSYVYIHYFNDTTLTRGNLSPMYTSTVDVKYIGRFYDGTAFDSSYLNTSPADSIFRTKLSGVISGWAIALNDMHVGDSCEVLIPYQWAYGSSKYGDIKPYSALQFNIKLVDIPGYEIQP
ncbi:MAG: FKBP-type peptidyl-prolyl cis-trans isomerase [Muribaculaceae bacterium]|nr:FKBP-type peptidyl-prolyl cis-trans isomerase [Muribaculaceae bacterium]